MPKKVTFEEFQRRTQEKYKDGFDLSMIDKNNFDYCGKNPIMCTKHNYLSYLTPKLMFRGKGYLCPYCMRENVTYNDGQKSNKRHKYKYSKEEIEEMLSKNPNIRYTLDKDFYYSHKKDTVEYSCQKHGLTFIKTMSQVKCSSHLCPLCAIEHTREQNIFNGVKRRERFIEEAVKVHGNQYDYSRVDVSGKLDKVEIICKEHGSFFQYPSMHLRGEGCPRCFKTLNNERRLGEIIKMRFPSLEVIPQWNGYGLGRQKLDYYIPSIKVGVEYQGPQHFEKCDWLDDYRHSLKHRIELDQKKHDICEKNGIKILYFTFNKKFKDIKYIDKVYTDIDEFVKMLRDEVTKWHI